MRVFKLDLDTLEILDCYKSISQASREVGCSVSAIREACRKIHKGINSNGYKWFAMDESTGLSYYGLKRNNEGNNLSLDEIQEILSVEKNEEYKIIIEKNIEDIMADIDTIADEDIKVILDTLGSLKKELLLELSTRQFKKREEL